MVGSTGVALWGWSIRAWTLGLLLTELGIIFLFVPAHWLEGVYRQERQLAASRLGEATLQRLEEKSSDWYQKLVVDTGIKPASAALCERQGKDRFDDRGFSNLFACRLEVFWLAVRHLFFRFAALEVWWPTALAFFLPILVDAYLQRCIRQNQFAYASPTIHYYSRLLISMLIMGLVLAPMLPWTLSPLNTPLALGICGVALWFRMAYTQKRL